MIKWKEPPNHIGDLLKQISLDLKPFDIIDPNANVTNIVYYLLVCIGILAREIYSLKVSSKVN